MTTALAERPTDTLGPDVTAPVEAPPAELEIDRDGIEVYCPDAGGWSRTRHFFCESCGATDHDLR